MSNVDLSIIIINYNTFHLTSNCIQSVYKWTLDVFYEIILVDNNSNECNPDLFKDKFPIIKLIKNNENVGFAKGNNIGIKHSIGNIILLLNSDTELIDNSIYKAYQILVTTNYVHVITGKLLFPDGQLQHQCGRFPSISRQLVELFRIQKLMPKDYREQFMLGGFFDHNRPVYPDWIWGTFFMFKREILKTFSFQSLPETFFMYAEDLEWCFYIKKSGFNILYTPEVSVIHYFSGSIARNDLTELKAKQITQNIKRFIIITKGELYYWFYNQLSNLIRRR